MAKTSASRRKNQQRPNNSIAEGEVVKPSADTNNQHVHHVSASWEAPLPPPGIMKQYPQKVQDDIVRGAREYRKRSIKTEEKIVDTESFIARAMVSTVVVVSITLTIGGIVMILLDKALAGAIFTAIGILLPGGDKILGAVFSRGESTKSQSKDKKQI